MKAVFVVLLMIAGASDAARPPGRAAIPAGAVWQNYNPRRAASGVPVDPIIEEPLRPLFPVTTPIPTDAAPRCGPMGFPAALIMAMFFCACPPRHTRRRQEVASQK